ncbi:hypothetical protein HGRIS_011412 [Hohenbuehelia grisea]
MRLAITMRDPHSESLFRDLHVSVYRLPTARKRLIPTIRDGLPSAMRFIRFLHNTPSCQLDPRLIKGADEIFVRIYMVLDGLQHDRFTQAHSDALKGLRSKKEYMESEHNDELERMTAEFSQKIKCQLENHETSASPQLPLDVSPDSPRDNVSAAIEAGVTEETSLESLQADADFDFLNYINAILELDNPAADLAKWAKSSKHARVISHLELSLKFVTPFDALFEAYLEPVAFEGYHRGGPIPTMMDNGKDATSKQDVATGSNVLIQEFLPLRSKPRPDILCEENPTSSALTNEVFDDYIQTMLKDIDDPYFLNGEDLVTVEYPPKETFLQHVKLMYSPNLPAITSELATSHDCALHPESVLWSYHYFNGDIVYHRVERYIATSEPPCFGCVTFFRSFNVYLLGELEEEIQAKPNLAKSQISAVDLRVSHTPPLIPWCIPLGLECCTLEMQREIVRRMSISVKTIIRRLLGALVASVKLQTFVPVMPVPIQFRI